MSDTLQPDPAPFAASPGSEIVPQGRGCVGSIVSNGCGCLAFLVGAGLAVALFGANLLSGWGARAIEAYIGQFVDGTVEVSGVDLAWSRPQKAQSVAIFAADGSPLIQARLELPSLLDLLGDDEGERAFVIQIRSLQSQVDADGTSDLGRTFGLVAEDGRTVFDALEERVADALTSLRRDVEGSSLRVELLIDDGSIDDTVSGRGMLHVDAFRLVATASRINARFHLRECSLSWLGRERPADADFDLRFDYADDGGLQLTQAEINTPPLPEDVLETLGIVSRVDDAGAEERTRRSRDIYGAIGERGLGELWAAVSDGAELRATFGSPAGGGDPLLSVTVDGEALDVEFDAAWRDGALVPVVLEEDRAPLRAEFRFRRGRLVDLFDAVTPDGVLVSDLHPEAIWTLESRDFRLPLDASDLVVGADDARGSVPERLTGWLRDIEIDASLRNTSDGPAVLRLDVEGGDPDGGDAVQWSHRVTNLALAGRRGGRLESFWRSPRTRSGFATFVLDLPARGPGTEDELATLGVTIPALSTAMLETAAPLPQELRVLLPDRLHKLELGGLAVARLLGSTRVQQPPVLVDVWTAPTIRFLGEFKDGVVRVPQVRVPMEITEEVCESMLCRVLPWLEAIEPLEEDAELTVELRDFSFAPGSGELREDGEATLVCPPLRVKLRPSLASHFALEDPGGWIDWTPAPIVLSLEPNVVRYRKVELPLGDDVDPSLMSGRLDREDEVLSLTGLVAGSALSGNEGAGLLPVEVTIQGPPEELGLLVSRDYLERTLRGLRDKVVPGGGE